MTWTMGVLNLLMALGWFLMDGSFAPWATGFGILGVVLAVMFLATRLSAMKAYRADEAQDRRPASLQAAEA